MIPLIGDIKVVKEEGSEGRGCMYTYSWFMQLYSRNQHNIGKRLYSNFKNLKKKKNYLISINLGLFPGAHQELQRHSYQEIPRIQRVFPGTKDNDQSCSLLYNNSAYKSLLISIISGQISQEPPGFPLRHQLSQEASLELRAHQAGSDGRTVIMHTL